MFSPYPHYIKRHPNGVVEVRCVICDETGERLTRLFDANFNDFGFFIRNPEDLDAAIAAENKWLSAEGFGPISASAREAILRKCKSNSVIALRAASKNITSQEQGE